MNACTAETDCVAIIIFLFGSRSINTPAKSDKKRIGRNWSAVAVPSTTAEPVRVMTSHASATFCIHVPVTEISWEIQYNR